MWNLGTMTHQLLFIGLHVLLLVGSPLSQQTVSRLFWLQQTVMLPSITLVLLHLVLYQRIQFHLVTFSAFYQLLTERPQLFCHGDSSPSLPVCVAVGSNTRPPFEGHTDDSASAPRFLLGDEATSTAEVSSVPRVFLTDGQETGGPFKSSFTTDPTSTFTFDLSVFLVLGGETSLALEMS
jgi:hypothetical protein